MATAKWTFSLILLALLAGVRLALASADGDVLMKSGLAGNWALDCAKPAARDNMYSKFEIAGDGRVVVTYTYDAEVPKRTSTVTNLSIVSPGHVGYTITGVDGKPLNLVVLIEGDRRRTWSSIKSSGEVLIKDGLAKPDGSQTKWFHRCPN